MDLVSDRGRRWKGKDADERQAERRDKLLDAGLTLLAESGPGAVTMRGVCRAAGLTERYFYESFPSREAMLVDLLTSVVDDAESVLREAVVSAGDDPGQIIALAAQNFTRFVAGDQRRGSIMFVHSLSPELYPAAREHVGRITSVMADAREMLLAVAGQDPVDAGATVDTSPSESTATTAELALRWDPLALFGATAFIYQDWLGPQPQAGVDDVAEYVAVLVWRFLLSRG